MCACVVCVCVLCVSVCVVRAQTTLAFGSLSHTISSPETMATDLSALTMPMTTAGTVA